MNCNSCQFPIGEKETIGVCGVCAKSTHSFCLIPKDDKMVCDVCYVLNVQEVKSYQFELPEAIRRTNIETYRKCPNKFKLEVLENNPQPPKTYTQVGIDLHEIFEEVLHDRSITKMEQIAKYTEYLKAHREMKLYVDEQEENNFTKRAMDCIENFNEVVKALPKPFVTEETIYYEVAPDLPKVRFTMDAIFEEPDGSLALLDWKTGKELVGKQLAEDLQAPLYIFGVEQKYGRPVSRFTFHYLKDNKVREFVRREDGVFVCTVGKREYKINLNEMLGTVKSLFTRIKNGDFNIPRETKGMYFTCKMCHLQEQGLCSGADTEAWKNNWRG